MKVYVIYDPLHERVRGVYSNEDIAYKKCNELDKKWGNDYVYPHHAIPFEIDKEYKEGLR
jgi:hypothetical protein